MWSHYCHRIYAQLAPITQYSTYCNSTNPCHTYESHWNDKSVINCQITKATGPLSLWNLNHCSQQMIINWILLILPQLLIRQRKWRLPCHACKTYTFKLCSLLKWVLGHLLEVIRRMPIITMHTDCATQSCWRS